MMPKPNRDHITRPADWRTWRVSICLAVMASSRTEIVCVSDEKVTFSGFSSDFMALKNEPFLGGTSVLYAGDDAQYAPLIFELATTLAKESQGHPREIADAFDEAYHSQVSQLIEKRVLRRYGFDTESFVKNGKKLCSAALYAKICERIDKVKISLRFLICGFDSNGEAHIFTAGGDQSVEGFDHLGVWAIGEGDHAALAAMSFHISHKHARPPWDSLGKAVTLALSAKFMAESTATVGQGTFVVVIKKDSPCVFLDEAHVDQIREEWLKTGSLRFSQEILNQVPGLLHLALSAQKAQGSTQ